jgi:hypothetical protein
MGHDGHRRRMITWADLKGWGGWVAGALAAIGTLWTHSGIKKWTERIRSVEVKTDGLLEWRSRADRAEAKLDEQADVRGRAEKHERDK